MDDRSPQIHVLSSRVGDLIEGKTARRKTKLVASLTLRGGAVAENADVCRSEIRPAVSKSSGEPKYKAASEFFQSSMISAE
jgi:hypothetical protein